MINRLLRLNFAPSTMSSALILYLMAEGETDRGLKRLRRAAKMASDIAVRAKVRELRSPRFSIETLKSLDEAATVLEYIVGACEERRALDELESS